MCTMVEKAEIACGSGLDASVAVGGNAPVDNPEDVEHED